MITHTAFTGSPSWHDRHLRNLFHRRNSMIKTSSHKLANAILVLLTTLSITTGVCQPLWAHDSPGARVLHGKSAATKKKTGTIDPASLAPLCRQLQNIMACLAAKTRAPRTASPLRTILMSEKNKKIALTPVLEKRDKSEPWKLIVHEQNGTPVFLGKSRTGTWSLRIKRPAGPSLPARQKALRYIEENRALFCLKNPFEELRVADEHRDEFGRQHITFKQFWQGVPVWGHDLVMHLDADGELYACNARYSPSPEEIDPDEVYVTAAEAVSIAEEDLLFDTAIDNLSEPARALLGYDGPAATKYVWTDPATQESFCVWHIQIRPNFRDNWYYFIDAVTGEVRERYNATATEGAVTAQAVGLDNAVRTIDVYRHDEAFYMINASLPMWLPDQSDPVNNPQGALWTLDLRGTDLGNQAQVYYVTSLDNTWNDPAAVSAHYHMGLVYDYYYSTHGRNGIDGDGSTIISLVHVTDGGNAMDNAYWNGKVCVFGDGNMLYMPIAGALDAVAHEMTHGVTQYTVNLEYKFQSGALNESFSDIFAAMVDRDDWLIGEDIVNTFYYPSGAMRDMEDPHNGGSSLEEFGWNPAHMDEYVELDITQDNGGVHVNAMIPARACVLIADAIGREKTEKIFYRVYEARYLNSQAQFVDMRLAAVRAAADLFGDLSEEVSAVEEAYDTVGIVGETGTRQPEDLPAVQGDQWVAVVGGDGTPYLARPVLESETDIVQLTTTRVFTGSYKPISISDDGSVIIFVDDKNFVRIISFDGTGEKIISETGQFSSIALSPDGTMLAATSIYQDSSIYIFDLTSGTSKTVTLYNPTTSHEGAHAGTVLYADVLDWDLSSRLLIYDSFNQVPKVTGDAITFWDVNILDVDNEIIFPLFPPQKEGIHIINPSFAQTNDNYFVFDLVDQNQATIAIMAGNLFSGEVNFIENNGSFAGVPKYSTDDRRIVFQRMEADASYVFQIPVTEDRMQAAGQAKDYLSNARLPTWFAVGTRPGDTTTTTTAPSEEVCVLSASLKQQEALTALRTFRDTRLQGERGIVLTAMYYRNSAEAAGIVAADPVLRTTLQELARQNTHRIQALAAEKDVYITQDALDDIVSFLRDVSAQAAPQLQRDISEILDGIESRLLLRQMGIQLQ